MKNLKVCLASVALFALMGLFQNCSPVDFATNPAVASVTNDGTDGPLDDGTIPPGNCHTVFDSLQSPVELIFVVDASSSNNSTDPDQTVRATSLDRFYQAYKSKTNFAWDVISFAGSTATVRAQAGTASSVETFISWLYAYPHDIKGTPYEPALTKVIDLINGDQNASAQKKYVVVFLSDGRPSGTKPDSYWSSLTEKIAGLLPGRISVSTIYYGDTNAEASGLLESMAKAGKGNFLDTNRNPNGKAFEIADFATVPGEVCQ